MARHEKRIARLRQNPAHVRPDDLAIVLQGEGFSVRQRGTNHKVYTRGEDMLAVPQRRPFLNEVYVRQALKLIDPEGEDD